MSSLDRKKSYQVGLPNEIFFLSQVNETSLTVNKFS